MVERPAPGGVPDPGASRNGLASMPVRTPTCGTKPGAVGAEDMGLLVLFSPWRLVLPLHRILHRRRSGGGSARV